MLEHVTASVVLPRWGAVATLGALVGVGAMWLYGKISPQTRIAALKATAASARREMLAYKGSDFRVAWRLARRAISPSLAKLGLSLGPALVAALPIVGVMTWVEMGHGHQVVFVVSMSIAAVATKVALRIG